MSRAVDIVWGLPLLILLLGGGLYFLFYSRFLPFKYFTHAIKILTGKYDNESGKGQLTHFQALSGALAATVGMGNISGVALAIAAGGPGAIFWMWVSAFIGIATKFFTCTLAVLFRGEDSLGEIQGGPMYVIREGLGKKWMGLAIFFAVAGFFGATPIFQANQMVAVFKNVMLKPNGIENAFTIDLILGLTIAGITALVILGGIKRIGTVASRLVPFMVLTYVVSVLVIMGLNVEEIIPAFASILSDAFTGQAVLGGALGALIMEGAKRAAFSNEAGIGMAPMMHGAAKTKEPVREGLVAMLEPFIDTLIVCTMTGICIIITGVWQNGESDGILMTANAFRSSLGDVGTYILMICVMIFAITTIFGMAYYGRKCLSFLIGAKYGKYFNFWYLFIVVIGSVSTLSDVINVVFIAYGLMAFPTMISALILAPKVMDAARSYLATIR